MFRKKNASRKSPHPLSGTSRRRAARVRHRIDLNPWLELEKRQLLASSVQVINLNDDGPGSLRSAFENPGPGLTVAQIDVAGTVNLTSGPLTLGMFQNVEIEDPVSHPLPFTINGNGGTILVIAGGSLQSDGPVTWTGGAPSGSYSSSIVVGTIGAIAGTLQLESGAITDCTDAISAEPGDLVSLQGVNVSGNFGSSVIEGSSFQLETQSCTINNNTASTTFNVSAALHQQTSQATFSNDALANNSGPGIFQSTQVVVQYTTLTGDTALDFALYGGRSTFSDNIFDDEIGGGIANIGASVTSTGDEFQNNPGVSVINYSGTLTLNHDTWTMNTATAVQMSGGTVVLENGLIQDQNFNPTTNTVVSGISGAPIEYYPLGSAASTLTVEYTTGAHNYNTSASSVGGSFVGFSGGSGTGAASLTAISDTAYGGVVYAASGSAVLDGAGAININNTAAAPLVVSLTGLTFDNNVTSSGSATDPSSIAYAGLITGTGLTADLFADATPQVVGLAGSLLPSGGYNVLEGVPYTPTPPLVQPNWLATDIYTTSPVVGSFGLDGQVYVVPVVAGSAATTNPDPALEGVVRYEENRVRGNNTGATGVTVNLGTGKVTNNVVVAGIPLSPAGVFVGTTSVVPPRHVGGVRDFDQQRAPVVVVLSSSTGRPVAQKLLTVNYGGTTLIS